MSMGTDKQDLNPEVAARDAEERKKQEEALRLKSQLEDQRSKDIAAALAQQGRTATLLTGNTSNPNSSLLA